jgi:hypothetical protein
MHKTLRVDAVAAGDPVAAAARRVLARVAEERGGVAVSDAGPGPRVELAVEPGGAPEGYRIADAPGGVRVVGHDGRGLLYGAGRLLRDARFGAAGVSLGPWRGASAPVKPVRGMYFATHFHNFYHDAPLDAVRRYVEDLALWGCNALSVWFDMHHFDGLADPAARAMVERLRAVLATARDAGITPGLTTLANEGYANSPEALRADWTAGHDGYVHPPGGHYQREICPSKPGGLEFILRTRREMLRAFRDLDIGYVWLWPYDQGGCTCARCAPWGAHGFLRTAEPLARLIREECPNAKIVLSTWYFDHFTTGEWDGLARAFARGRPDWVDYLLADDNRDFADYPLRHGVPGNLPLVSFPEISMRGMWPWGAYGANPRPRHWQAYWNKAGALLDGFFPYSEGIYEDLNKVLPLQWGWDPARPAEDIVREYAAGHFAAEVAEDVRQAVDMMERDHGTGLGIRAGGADITIEQAMERGAQAGVPMEVFYRSLKLDEADACLALMNAADARLTPAARRSWRWRVLWLRAAIDAANRRTGGRATDETDAYLEELAALYHARHAEPAVLPPSRPAVARLTGTA